MSLYTKISLALAGIAGGIVVLFAADMILNSGRFVAHTLHAKTPDCSGSCHGPTADLRQDPESPAARLVLPSVQATDRSHAVARGAGSSVLLGVRVAIKGRH